ncbi:hypothetical protein SUNI508_13717 [Seiridium unicorne]|uniref:WW domain-containing protein n=1 Tax=Seiridium unicorne TaxID=138068 RepID=A0ABR2VBZ8_9PEZI
MSSSESKLAKGKGQNNNSSPGSNTQGPRNKKNQQQDNDAIPGSEPPQGTKKKKKTRGRTASERKAAAERRNGIEMSTSPTSSLVKAPTEKGLSRSNSVLSGAASSFTPSSESTIKLPAPQSSHHGPVASPGNKSATPEEEPRPRSNSTLSALTPEFQPTGVTPPAVTHDLNTYHVPASPLNEVGIQQQYSPVSPYSQVQWVPSPVAQYFPTQTLYPYQEYNFGTYNSFTSGYMPQQAPLIQYGAQPAHFPTQMQPSPPPQRRFTNPSAPLTINPGLPSGWIKRFLPNEKKYCYINIYSRKSQWEEPTKPAERPEQATENGPTELDTSEEAPPGSNTHSSASNSEQSKDMGPSGATIADKNSESATPSGAYGNTPFKSGPAAVHELVTSTLPSAHLAAACTTASLGIATSDIEAKSIPANTTFIPNPMTTFLIDKAEDLVCQLCQVTPLKLGKRTCRIDDSMPAILPCGHVAGARCLHQWMSTGRDYCPFDKFSLRHAKCRHLRLPHILDHDSILAVPRTVPSGGAFPDYCKTCRLEQEEVSEIVSVRNLKKRFVEAREAFEKDETEEKKQAMDVATRDFEEMAFESRGKRLGHLFILW